jgi:HEPN domain-containing protein
MPHDPVRVAEVRSWVSKAARDLLAADHERAATPPVLEDVVFHAQQAAEKVLKGFLTWHDRPFRKTHDLVEIGQACVDIDSSLEPAVREAAPLTEYAWKFRYPGEPEEPTRQEADAALAVARAVYEAILARLPSEVRP